MSCVVLTAVTAGCGGDDKSTPSDPPSKLTGVVLEIESERIGEVSSFTLKDGDHSYEILIDPEVEYGFPLAHLNDHKTTSDPVTVELEEKADQLYAQSIDDV